MLPFCVGRLGVDVDELDVFQPFLGIGLQFQQAADGPCVDGDALAATVRPFNQQCPIQLAETVAGSFLKLLLADRDDASLAVHVGRLVGRAEPDVFSGVECRMDGLTANRHRRSRQYTLTVLSRARDANPPSSPKASTTCRS